MSHIFLSTIIFSILTSFSFGQTTGPVSGSCLIMGGGRLDSSLYQLFLAKAGGENASIVIIPTASGDHPESRDSGYLKLKQRFAEQGIDSIKIAHTTDRSIANSNEFAAQIQSADGVWFTGGRQWRLVDAYAGTETERALEEMLLRGGIVAGTSAGATIQGSFLARGDTKTNTIMMGDHQKGFGYIQDVAIDQHVIARNRQFDLFEILQVHPHLLGIGLDEGSGMLIEGDLATVVGQSYVLIYDQSGTDEGLDTKNSCFFLSLKPGDKYDLKQRSIIK